MRAHLHDTPIGRLVTERPGRAEVFDRFGLDYCCEGRFALGEACARLGVDQEALLSALLEWEAQPPAAAEPDYAEWSVDQILDHILEVHHAYLHEEMEPLGALVRRVAAVHADSEPQLARMAHAYDFFREDMDAHLLKEEEVLFPALREIANNRRLPSFFLDDLHVPLLVMEGDHQRAEQSLRFFRSTLQGYVLPPEACELCRGMVARLRALERDLHRHMHLENEVLHPRVRAMTRR